MDQSKLEQLLVAKGIAVPIYCRETVGSTNDLLKQMDLRPFGASFALAEQQSAGRGRMERTFFSPPGGVYVSFAFQPKRKPRLPVTIAAAVAVCDAVEALCGLRPRIKWPNDILLDGKKLCGILAESYGSGRRGVVIVGVGLNLNTEVFPPDLQDSAVSLKQHLGRSFEFETAAAELMGTLRRLPDTAGLARGLQAGRQAAETLEQYRRDCVTLGQPVTFPLNNIPTLGMAESLAEDGALGIRLADNSLHLLPFGQAPVTLALSGSLESHDSENRLSL